MLELEHEHPHDSLQEIPDRLPPAVIRAYSQPRVAVALRAIALEWIAIAAACAVAAWSRHPVVYLVAVAFIGARQHALTILAHDAVHLRLLPGKRHNDLLANLLLAWPTFISVEGFRRFHVPHHRHTSLPGDGNRELWGTHDPQGRLSPEWVYPKTRAALAWILVRRAAVVTGLWWIVRGVLGSFVLGDPPRRLILRLGYYALIAAVLTWAGAWRGWLLLWIVPYCTWHVLIQYMRLICEHSAVHSDRPGYTVTRTTIPSRKESIFILPRNIGYHLEHHAYPSVPFYNLPALHRRLLQEPGFHQHANIQHSIFTALGQCVVGARSSGPSPVAPTGE
jgi:fatty acid desaturase